MNVLRKAILAAACTAGLAVAATPALAQTTLRVVMHSDLKILDPIWTTAYIVRNHGYMIYDTLFAQDEKGDDQAADGREVRDVGRQARRYTFTLRDGLLWHDGKPVTAEDCIASIKRWAAKDSLGQKMMSFVNDDRRRSTPRPSPSSSRSRPASCCSAWQSPRPTCRS